MDLIKLCTRSINLILVLTISVSVNCEVLVLPATPLDDKFDIVQNVKPFRYDIDIDLDTNPHLNYFNATTNIRFVSNVDSLVLAFHLILADQIVLHEISLTNLDSSEELSNFFVTYHDDSNEPLVNLVSNSQEFLRKNASYKLMVKSTVQFIEEQRTGVFRYCDDLDNCFVTTNFETYYIRESLPSFDNATLKAHFNIKIRHRDDMQALSNMPGKIITRNGDTVITMFEETPLMSTYLLAFVVGIFDRVEIENFSNIPMNLYMQTRLNRSSEYFEKYAGQFLHSLETYLNRSYPLPKLDFFASTTTTTSVRGMENWGLIGFDSKSALISPNVKHSRGIEIALGDIAHEIGHQFFGNLVSIKELKSMWLKEGITTYFTYYLLNDVFPHENYLDRLITTRMVGIMLIENVQDNFPLDQYTLDNFGESYVVYSKGGVFTNMLKNVLGEIAFQSVVRNFVNKFAYDSMSTDDLIHEIQLVNDVYQTIPDYVDIPGFMDSWINQNKFPLVNVTRNYTTGELEISQQCWDKNYWNRSELWWIPFNYATKLNPNFAETSPDGWFNGTHSNIFIPLLKANDWIVFNKQGSGYYIVNYDNQNWNLIVDVLASETDRNLIPAVDRAKILIDAILLYDAHLLSHDIMDRIIKSLQHEYSFGVWRVFRQAKKYLINKFGKYPINNLYNYYGLVERENDTREDQLVREIAFSLACGSGYQICIEDMNALSLDIITKLENGESFIIGRTLFKSVMRYGVDDDEQFRKLFKLVRQSGNASLQKIFSMVLDSHADKKSFLQFYMSSVYQLPLPDEPDTILPDTIFYKEDFNQIEVLYKCIEKLCYDFNTIYPNEMERQEVIYRIIEVTLHNIDQQQFLNLSIYDLPDLLELIDKRFGGNITERIRAKYDVTWRKYNTG